jgi:hypothetical protein
LKLLTAAFTLSTAPPQSPPPVAADDTDEATFDDGAVDPDDGAAADAVVAADPAADAAGTPAFEVLLLQPLRTVTVTTAATKVGAATLSQDLRRA